MWENQEDMVFNFEMINLEKKSLLVSTLSRVPENRLLEMIAIFQSSRSLCRTSSTSAYPRDILHYQGHDKKYAEMRQQFDWN